MASCISGPQAEVNCTLQGDPRLIAVKAEWRQQHHAYLAFSFPLEGTTSVLDIQGTHFQPVSLPGLDPNRPTLLLAALPGGWMVQVTDQVTHLLQDHHAMPQVAKLMQYHVHIATMHNPAVLRITWQRCAALCSSL